MIHSILSLDEERELKRIVKLNGGDPTNAVDVVTIWEEHKTYILRHRKDG